MPPTKSMPLTLAEQREHLLLFFFGTGADAVDRCIRRAYRDFNRTLHGLKNFPRASVPCRDYLHQRIQSLPLQDDLTAQEDFDIWHEATCVELITKFGLIGQTKMHIGQSQKWLNMALKYVFLFEDSEVSAYARFFPLCHIPIDNVILTSTPFQGAPSFGCPWSRIDDYAVYMNFQRWTRQKFVGRSPLAVEFEIWAQSASSHSAKNTSALGTLT